jgi:hypothetical protein
MPNVTPDDYESASDPNDTPNQSNVTLKHYQVTVPDFTEADGTTKVGTSFLRLGSSPSPQHVNNQPATFKASWDLANLVGNAAAIAAAEPAHDDAPSTYHGDPTYLLGFADDTRARPDGPSWTARQKETMKLLTKGGWWDHSDGNRVSTTVGDKIEIIQGNYKMVVLGRRALTDPALAANAMIRDISGGLVEENGPSPTHCIKTIEWTEHDNGSWSVYQNNGIGNVFSSFYGDVGDVFFGPHKESWTGLAPDGYDTSDFYKNSMQQHDIAGYPKLEADPDIRDHTWARSIRSYTGSSDKKVPKIIDETWAKTIESTTHADSITDTTRVGHILSDTQATDKHDLTAAAAVIDSLTTAPLINDLKLAVHILEIALALKTSITLSFGRNIYLGGRADLEMPFTHKLSIGIHNQLVVGQSVSTNLRDIQLTTGDKLLMAAAVVIGF